MQLVLYTWNGHAINDNYWSGSAGFRAWYDVGIRGNLTATPTYIQRAQAFPLLTGAVLDQHTFTIKLQCLGTYHSQRETLKSWFGVNDFQPHQLIAKDIADGSSTQWYIEGRVMRMVEEEQNVIAVTLALSDPVWRLATATSYTWNITASGQTHAFTIGGSNPAKPSLAITPTSGRTGQYAYKRFVTVYNPVAAAYPATVAAIDITNGGLDTATLVTGGKMLASCDDLRVFVDGQEVDRWLDGPNTAATKVYVNLPLNNRTRATLKTAIAGSGAVANIVFNTGTANLAALKRMKHAANKFLLIGSEVFQYTDVNLTTYKATGVTRARKGTSMAAHLANVTVIHLQYDIWMLYGNSAADTPAADDTLKPVLDLHNSTPTLWKWTNFTDSASVRAGEWNGAVLASLGKETTTFTGDYSGGTMYADPSTELGLSIQAYEKENVWKSETAKLLWSLYHPGGVTQVVYSGKKYRVGAGWPVVCGLQKSLDGETWTTASNQATPGSASSWTAFGPTTVSLGGTYKYIRFLERGSVPATSGAEASVQFDTLAVTLASANIPIVALGAEQSSYQVNSTITNNGTGESILISYPVELNKTITVDCVNKTATYEDGSTVPVVLSSQRVEWLTLTPGTCTLQCDDVGIAGQTIVVTWKEEGLL